MCCLDRRDGRETSALVELGGRPGRSIDVAKHPDEGVDLCPVCGRRTRGVWNSSVLGRRPPS